MNKSDWNDAIQELANNGLFLFDEYGNSRTGHEKSCMVYYAGYNEEDAMNVKVGKGYGGSITVSCSNKICYLEAIHDHCDIESD